MDARGAYCATPKTGKVVPVSAVSVGSWERLFQRPFFIFRAGLFLDFFFLFSESAKSVAPITFCQLPRSAKHAPYLSAGRLGGGTVGGHAIVR